MSSALILAAPAPHPRSIRPCRATRYGVQSLALALALTLTACGDPAGQAGQPGQPGQATAATPRDPLLVAAPESLGALLQTAPVVPRPLAETLRVAGRLDFDEQHLARIGATVTGRVTAIHAAPGSVVGAGQVLAEINSTELSNAQLAFLKARSLAELNRRNAERARSLFQADVIAAAELQRRENEYAMAQAEQRAAADQLQVLGMGARAVAVLAETGAIRSTAPVVASIAGVVVDRRIAQGQVVTPSDALFTVADLGRVWAIAEVPEQQAALVRVGQAVQIEVPALAAGEGQAPLVGKLIYVAETVNPDTRTVTVRTEIDNRERRLKPAMLATMLIASRPREVLVVPAQAVVREENRDHVFVRQDDGRYRLTPVELGPEQQGVRPVRSGLRNGMQVVTEGAFHLNNERKRSELEGS